MRKAHIAFAAAMAAVGLGISGCSDGNDTDGSATKESPAASAPQSPASESPAAAEGGSEGGEAPAAGDVTKPGSKLKVGDRAVLPFEYTSKKKGTIAVTVTAITKGVESDMAKFGTKAKGMTPYFIKLKVENVGGTDLSYASLKLRGVLSNGQGTGVILIGDIPGKCDSENASAEFTTKGASFETCSLSATTGAPVTGAEFDEGDAYSDTPVLWTS